MSGFSPNRKELEARLRQIENYLATLPAVEPPVSLTPPPPPAARPATAIPEAFVIFDPADGHAHDGEDGGAAVGLTGDLDGTNLAAVVVGLRGVAVPAPTAGDDRKVLEYQHGGPAFAYRTLLAAPGIDVGAQAGDEIEVTVQARDAAGNALAGRRVVRVWLAATEFGAVTGSPPDGGVTVAGGALLEEFAANASWEFLTDGDGKVVLTLEESGAETWWLHAAVGSELVAAAEVAFAV